MNEGSDTAAAATPGERRNLPWLLALLTPFVALALSRLFWGVIQPHVWFLFYPAVFISSWFGGRRLGIIATVFSTLLVWWFFLRPESAFFLDPRHLLQAGVFCLTGIAFAFFHDRLTRAVAALAAKKQLDADLRTMTKLHEIGSLFLSEGGHLEPVLTKIIDASIEVTGADFGNIQLLDPRSSALKIVAHRGLSNEWLDFWNSVSAGKGTYGTVLERGERLIVEDLERSSISPGTPVLEFQRKAGVRAVQSTPLVTRSGKPIGMFSTHHKTPHRPDARELRFLDLIARQAADIVETWEANQTTLEALAASERANQKLSRLINENRVFGAFIENSSDFIGIADAMGKPIYVNPAGRRMVGLSAEHPIEDTQIPDYYVPDERSFALNEILSTVVEKGQWEGETYFRNWRTEEAIPVSDKHFMIRAAETGEILGIGTITRDITEKKELEGELVEAREFLENVFESSTEYSIIAKDLERRVVGWNTGAARIYGYDAADVLGRSSDMLYVVEDIRSGIVAELHERALKEGRATGLFRRRRKNGSEFLARVTITRRNDVAGKPIGYLIVSHDVTAEQRHVAEQRFLAEVGEALQGTLDYNATVERVAQLAVGFVGSACAIDVVEKDGNVTRMRVVHSEPAKTALAQAVEQIVPKRPHPLWHVLDTKQPLLIPEVTADLLHSTGITEEHRRLLEAMGVQSAMIIPIITRNQLTGALTIASCVPNRRYGPEDMRLGSELARRASLAMENARLYEVAQQSIRARDQVLGVVAHDLRNPLGAILMNASLLRRNADALERESSKPAELIERAATRMNRLIEDLLDVTRMEGGRLSIEQGRVSTEQIVLESAETQKALAASASLELRLNLQEHLPDVWADRHRLLQVFENLIGNAVKFTDPSGRITLGAASRDRDVLFWVSDTGCGIAADDLPHVFERYWQAEESAKRGTGLGLPIVKGIVEAHGGRIWVESARGQGSSFFFTVPTAVPLAEEVRPESAPQY